VNSAVSVLEVHLRSPCLLAASDVPSLLSNSVSEFHYTLVQIEMEAVVARPTNEASSPAAHCGRDGGTPVKRTASVAPPALGGDELPVVGPDPDEKFTLDEDEKFD
jgi:hypothetical protein